MELKFFVDKDGFVHERSSNRTFMELKSDEEEHRHRLNLCSNRTFMELKCAAPRQYYDKNTRSNRTFMELKSLYAIASLRLA